MDPGRLAVGSSGASFEETAMPQRYFRLPIWGWLLGVILVGGVLRFVGLTSLVYWHDEAYTSLRIAGSTAVELQNQLFTGALISVDDLLAYQRLNPERGLEATLNALIVEDVQHAPLYYAMVRFWAQLWGSSIGAIRSLSALIGVGALPAAYWLGRELFDSSHNSDSRWAAAIFVVLLAVSPLQLLYAQEAREYGLWTLTTLLASAALLRALRRSTVDSWSLYGVILVLGLYTHLFMVLTALGHGLYILLVTRSASRLMALRTLAAAAIAFAPWLWFVLNPEARQGIDWIAVHITWRQMLHGWGNHLLRAFTLPPADGSLSPTLFYGVLPLLVALVVYSSVHMIRTTPRGIWSLPLLLSGSSFLPLLILDLWLGGQRSQPSRYLMPLYIGILLPLAHLFAVQINQPQRRRRLWWGGLCALFVGANLFACLGVIRATTAWTKDISYNLHAVAAPINAAPEPLLVGTAIGFNTGTLLALSHYLKPTTRLQLIDDRQRPDFLRLPTLPQDPGSVFLLNGTLPLRLWLELENQRVAEQVSKDPYLTLWHLYERNHAANIPPVFPGRADYW